MNNVLIACHNTRFIITPGVSNIFVFLFVSIALSMSYSFQAQGASSRPASACFTLRDEVAHLIDSVGAGGYNISAERLANRPFSEVDEKDVFGEWISSTDDGESFVINLDPGFGFTCQRKDERDVGLIGIYYFGRNNRTGQIALRFTVHKVHSQGRTRMLFPAPPTYTAIIERIAAHQMVVPSLHVRRTQEGFAYGLTSGPVTWKRGGDHAACADLRRLKARYDKEAHPRLQEFKKTEKDALGAIVRIADDIERAKKRLKRVEKDAEEHRDSGWIPDRVPRSVPEVLLAVYLYFLRAEGYEYISDELRDEMRRLSEKEEALIAEWLTEGDHFGQCAAFLSDYHFLKAGLRCD